MTITPRGDIFYEVSDVLDSSGNWTGDWIDSSQILSFVVGFHVSGGSNPELSVAGSIDGSTSIGGGEIIAANAAELYTDVVTLPYRYFRFSTTGAGSARAGDTIVITARVYEPCE